MGAYDSSGRCPVTGAIEKALGLVDHPGDTDSAEALISARAELAAIREGYGDAVALFQSVAPQCEPLADLRGVISQLSNYIAGTNALREENARKAAEIERLLYYCDRAGKEIVANEDAQALRHLQAADFSVGSTIAGAASSGGRILRAEKRRSRPARRGTIGAGTGHQRGHSER
jgi:hypothetical protein